MMLLLPKRDIWTNVFLWVAFLNAVLRLAPESDITLFRIMLPFAFFAFFLIRDSRLQWFITIVFIFFVLQILSVAVGGYPLSRLQFVFMSHYLVMIFLFFVTYEYFCRTPLNFYHMLRVFYVVLVVLMGVEYFASFDLPNTNGRGVTGWYWNQNDASLALAAFFILAVRAGDTSQMVPVHFAALTLMAINESRAALWGCMAYAAFWYSSAYWYKKHWGNSLKGLAVSLASISIVLVALLLATSALDKVAEQLTRGALIVLGYRDDVSSIISIDVRANAASYALADFVRSYGLGIGSGNSIALLQKINDKDLFLIKSIHNMPLQMILELGFPFIVVLIIGIFQCSKLRFVDFFIVLSSYCFISLSQSGGFMVNYFPLACFYFAITVPVHSIGEELLSVRGLEDSKVV